MYYNPTPETQPNIDPYAVDFSKERVSTIFDASDAMEVAANSMTDKIVEAQKSSDAMFNSSFSAPQIEQSQTTIHPQQEVRLESAANSSVSRVDKLTHDAQSFAVDMRSFFADQGTKV